MLMKIHYGKLAFRHCHKLITPHASQMIKAILRLKLDIETSLVEAWLEERKLNAYLLLLFRHDDPIIIDNWFKLLLNCTASSVLNYQLSWETCSSVSFNPIGILKLLWKQALGVFRIRATIFDFPFVHSICTLSLLRKCTLCNCL